MSRPDFTADDVYDSVRVLIEWGDHYAAHGIETYHRGEFVSVLRPISYGRWPEDLFALIDARHEAGTIAVSYSTWWGDIREGEVPEWAEPYIRQRDPFRRVRSSPLPTLTTEEQRRETVRMWARENTRPRLWAKGTIDAWEHRGPNRPKAVIWWHFVLMNLAAAQHGPWLSDEDVWPAIERNIEIDFQTFLDTVDVALWHEPATYMEALSRMYKANSYLSQAPVWVRLIPPALSNLHAGSDAAKAIIYGD